MRSFFLLSLLFVFSVQYGPMGPGQTVHPARSEVIRAEQGEIKQAWAARYNNSAANGDDWAQRVVTDSSGNVYVTGFSDNGRNNDYATVKYDPRGNQVWAARYDHGGHDYAIDLAVDGSGNVYVTGSSHNGKDNDYATVKYDSSGKEIWVKRYNNSNRKGSLGDDMARGIAVDAAGHIYVTGRSSNGTNDDFATVKYDAAGNQGWVTRYDSSARISSYNDASNAIVLDTSGNIYVTGYSFNGKNNDYTTVKYNSSGKQHWVARYDNNGRQDYAGFVAVDGSGNVYVSGDSVQPTSFDYDFLTVKFDSNGRRLWARTYHNALDDSVSELGLDTAGNVYVTGQSPNGVNMDYATIKYDSTGNQVWVVRYDAKRGDDVPQAFVLDGSGNIYVTGFSFNGVSEEYATVKYDATGKQVWVARYDQSSSDLAEAVAIDSAGHIYVTGSSRGNGTNLDYATVKYVQP